MGSSPVSFVDDVQEALGRLSGRHFSLLLTPISVRAGRPVREKWRYLRFRCTQLRIFEDEPSQWETIGVLQLGTKLEDHGTNRFRASNQFGFDPGYETLRVQFSLRRGHPPPQGISRTCPNWGAKPAAGAVLGHLTESQ